MKKSLCAVIAVFLVTCILSGCIPTVEDITPDPSPVLSSEPIVEPSLNSSSEPTVESPFAPSMEPSLEPSLSMPTESTPEPSLNLPMAAAAEPSSGLALNIADEPPLDERSLSVAVPDFLDSEQQLLYRRAYCVYSHLFGGDTGEVNVWQKGDTYPYGVTDVEHNGRFYTRACGRYAVWADFDALVHSVFTDEFWIKINGGSEDGTFIDIDGYLHFVWASKGMYYYNDNIPDKFRLISKEEDEIIFTLIGHYKSPWFGESGTEESQNSSNDYTIEFPIKLVQTQKGWRFAEFHSALADQRGLDEQ